MKKNLIEKPIIIVGAPRSGTTFLCQGLGIHSTLALLIEPRLIWKFGNDGKSDVLHKKDARPEVVTHIQNKFSEFITSKGKTRLLEKTPSSALRLEFIDAVFPDAKFVNIVRHGKDSALSIRSYWAKSSVGFKNIDQKRLAIRIKEMKLKQCPYYFKEFAKRFVGGIRKKGMKSALWGPRLPGMAGMVAELDPLEVTALQWRTCVELSCSYGRTLPNDRYLELRLETLDDHTIGRILEFCELEPEAAVVERFKEKFDKEKVGARRKEMTDQEDDLLERWLRPTLDWLGYSD